MIQLKRPSLLLLLTSLLSLSVGTAVAAPAQQEQLDQSRAQEAARQERLGAERVETIATPPSSNLPADETVRFPIAKIVLENESGRFYFLRHIARDYEGRELSLKEINEAVGKMNHELMQRGFSTSRVVIPEQNLSEGTLRLVLQIGRIHAVRFAEDSDTLYTYNLFPFREGDVLNVRDIEQGIEQAKRLPSQDISVQLLPSDQPQRTDVVLTHGKTREEFLRHHLGG